MKITPAETLVFNPALIASLGRWVTRLLARLAMVFRFHQEPSAEIATEVGGGTSSAGPIPTSFKKATALFRWQDAANRGLTLLANCSDTTLQKDQQNRLFLVLTKLLEEDTKDAYMVWEDLNYIGGIRPDQGLWLHAIVRRLRHSLRVRPVGPGVTDENLLAAFGSWDDSITRTLRNINLVVTAARAVPETSIVIAPLWRTVLCYFASLIATDQQVLSCYSEYWMSLHGQITNHHPPSFLIH
jgi:hypothetical protein